MVKQGKNGASSEDYLDLKEGSLLRDSPFLSVSLEEKFSEWLTLLSKVWGEFAQLIHHA